MYTYYTFARPANPWTVPEGFVDIENLDYVMVPEIGRKAWSKVFYNERLDKKAVRDYELIPGFVDDDTVAEIKRQVAEMAPDAIFGEYSLEGYLPVEFDGNTLKVSLDDDGNIEVM